MANRSGLVYLVDQVRELVHNVDASVVVELGFRKRPQQLNQSPGRANRIVFIPSSPNGGAGALVAPRSPGNRADDSRILRTWHRELTVSIWAVDPTDRSDEAKQLEAIETLLELTMQAVQRVAHATAEWGDPVWTVPAEISFGLELLVPLTFKTPIFDADAERVFPSFALTKVPPT